MKFSSILRHFFFFVLTVEHSILLFSKSSVYASFYFQIFLSFLMKKMFFLDALNINVADATLTHETTKGMIVVPLANLFLN